MASSSSDIGNIVSLARYSSFLSLLPMVFWLPFGVCIGIVRLCIFLHLLLVSHLLPTGFPFKRFILRCMLCSAGLPIFVQGSPASSDKKKRVFIANHVTNLDPFILALLNPLILALESPVSQSVSSTQGKLNTFVMPGDKDHSEVVQYAKAKVAESETPLLFFPEKLKTNGKKSILKFGALPFELDCPIQPVTIQTTRYFFNINVSTYSSSLYEDMAWCAFMPLTIFRVRYLPVTERKSDEEQQEFVSRVQLNMARSLNLSASEMSAHDVIDQVKTSTIKRQMPAARPEAHPSQPAASQSSSCPASHQPASPARGVTVEPEMSKMLQQVKDVLPEVANHAILTDLRVTKDVDATIANILDGKVDTSEPKDLPEKPLTSLSEGVAFKASTFSSSARGRQLSFEERKQAMLESARLKYRIKHGL